MLIVSRQDIRRFRHEVDAAEHNPLRLLRCCRLFGQQIGVASEIGELDNIVALIVVTEHRYLGAKFLPRVPNSILNMLRGHSKIASRHLLPPHAGVELVLKSARSEVAVGLTECRLLQLGYRDDPTFGTRCNVDHSSAGVAVKTPMTIVLGNITSILTPEPDTSTSSSLTNRLTNMVIRRWWLRFGPPSLSVQRIPSAHLRSNGR